MEQNLIQELKPYIGAKIIGTFLLIWPCEEGIEHADTQLNLELALPIDKVLHTTFRTGADGQTPSIEEEVVIGASHYDNSIEREKVWAAGDFFEGRSVSVEAFDISSTRKFPSLVGKLIHRIDLVCLRKSGAPVGVKLTADSGAELWSVSADDGNRIFAKLPPDWFDEEIVLHQVS